MRLTRSAIAAAALLSVPIAAQMGGHDQRARRVFEELITIDTTPAHGTTAAARTMAARFRDAGFAESDIRIVGADPDKQNLVVRYHGSGPRRPLLLLAHLDVVDAKRDDWSFEPFLLTERGDFFYGRGTTDDKSMAAHFVANLIRLHEEHFTPNRDLILALTADEEGGKSNGVQWLLENKRDLIDAAYALNEGGGGIVRDGRYVVNEVQAAEKVYLDLRLEVRNVGGHSSLPVRDNAIARLAAGVTRLSGYDFPMRLTDITRAYFERSAAVQRDKELAADMRLVAGRAADMKAAARLAAFSPYFNAMMRTTCVPTRLEGGHANNALPQTAAAIVNCRLLPGDDADVVRERVRDVVGDRAIEVSFVDAATPSQPTTLIPEVMQAVEKITGEMFPGVVVVPAMSTGATDGLFLRNAGIPTFGVDGTFGDPDDVRAHGRDERIGVKQFYEGLEFQYRLLKVLAGS
jgi:acetylornithine deacetylase/succinyl-diaminopimelate desuccinylase-like protein